MYKYLKPRDTDTVEMLQRYLDEVLNPRIEKLNKIYKEYKENHDRAVAQFDIYTYKTIAKYHLNPNRRMKKEILMRIRELEKQNKDV